MIPANRKNRNLRRRQNNCPNNIKYNQPPEVRNEPNCVVKNEPKKNTNKDPLNMNGRSLSDILKSQITHEIDAESKNKTEKVVEKTKVKEPEKVEETKAKETKTEETKAKKTKTEETKAEETKAEKTKAEKTKSEETKTEETKEVKEKKAELKLYDNSKAEEHSMLVEWDIEELGKYDRIAIYQHQRFHDTHYLQIFNVKENTGKYIFKGLVDGCYDVRLLNWNTRYKNIPIIDCYLGEKVDIKVEIPKDVYPPILKVLIPGKSITDKNDYVAIYNKSEHSNEFNKSLMVCYMNKAKFVNENETNEDAMKYVQFDLKNMIGDYIVKYFHYNSTSMLHGNVYSGICEFSVENYNKLDVEIDKENKKITINWRIYTIEPNNSQWIGICDENNKLRHYEYVCYHKYDNDSKMKGTVIIENNKFTEAFFADPKELEKKEEVKDEKKAEMEKTIEEEKTDDKAEKTWKVKFYNKGMFMSSKLMEIPINRINC